MKKFSILMTVCVVLMGCKNNSHPEKDGYTIQVSASTLPEGSRAFLKSVDRQRNETARDSAIVKDGILTFTNRTERPQLYYLSIANVPGNFPFIIENTGFNIRADVSDLAKSTVSGSVSNDAFSFYTSNFKKLADTRNDLLLKNKEVRISGNSEIKSEIANEIKDLNRKLADYPLDFLKNQPSTSFSLLLMENLLATKSVEVAEIKKQYDALNEEFKNTPLGQSILEQITAATSHVASTNNVSIGHKAPNFSGPNPDGKIVSLEENLGKVTIIDFWASWCGPCRKENPNVVKIFEKYHSKGLEIIGVSLDRPGHKDRWMKAIEDDQLTWHHVSNLNYFNDPIAKMYRINAIPATYILDASGTIVAKNLRGSELEAKIAELLE